MKKLLLPRAAIATTWLVFAVSAPAANLITNGDFSAGNSGFTSGYNYSHPMYWQPTHYDVGSVSPVFDDHTEGGTDSVMMVDGAYSGATVVWQQTVNVTPNTGYDFVAWGRYYMRGTGPTVTLSFTANGSSLGTLSLITYPDDVWQSFARHWDSGTNTSLTLQIFDLQSNNSVPGNDFALDDISLTTSEATPPPLTVSLVTNTVIVSWPDTGAFSLLQNGSLANPNGWTTNTSWTTSNGTNSLINANPAGNLFFRLVK